ncbi:Uncharacterised protein [Mycobacteroides abscessus subsp. abscessus]|nr:Uncharacterised protein [Mycobacteroides abscessus subsp. abscessus]
MESLLEWLAHNRELVQAISPVATATIALIALAVALFNTRSQIDANARNVERQLYANNESVTKQLSSQAREAESNRKAQLHHTVRTQRRETLIKAAELSLKLEAECVEMERIRRRALTKWPSEPPSAEETAEELQSLFERRDAIRAEIEFVAVTLEVDGLPDLGRRLGHYYLVAQGCITGGGNPSEGHSVGHVREARGKLVSEFADALRAGAD